MRFDAQARSHHEELWQEQARAEEKIGWGMVNRTWKTRLMGGGFLLTDGMQRPDTCAARHIVPMLFRECGEVRSKQQAWFTKTFGTFRARGRQQENFLRLFPLLYNPSMDKLKLQIRRKELEAFCRKHRIQKLAFFGSVLREDFKSTSDVDVLVEFEKGYTPGLTFYAMPDELKKILGRNVDVLTFQGVKTSRNPIRRKAILESAQVYYVA